MYHSIIDSKADNLVLFHSVFMGLCWAMTACFPVFALKAPLFIFPAPDTVNPGKKYDHKDLWKYKPPFVAKNPKLIPFEVPSKGKMGKMGYKNRSGKIVLPAIYSWAGPFNDYGIAPVACDKPITGKHKPHAKGQIDDVVPDNPLGCFYINEKGEKIADAYEVDNGWDYPTRDGIVRITKNGKVGLMHISGKILAEPQYTTLNHLRHTPLWFTGRGQKVRRGGGGCCHGDTEFGGTYGLLNSNGKEVAPVNSQVERFYLDSDNKILTLKQIVKDIDTYRYFLVVYKGAQAYIVYRNAKNEWGLRRESEYDEGSGLKPELVKESLLVTDVHTHTTY